MKLLDPKNLQDAKDLIDSSIGKGGHSWWDLPENIKKAIDGWNRLIDGVFSIGDFISSVLNDPYILVDILKDIAPDIVLLFLAALIVLRFLGFEKTNKYILLTLVIAFIISIM